MKESTKDMVKVAGAMAGTCVCCSALFTLCGLACCMATHDWTTAYQCTAFGVVTGITLGTVAAIATHLHNEGELSF